MGFLDAELSLEESDLSAVPLGSFLVCNDGAEANIVDMGPGPFGPTPMFLLMQVTEAFVLNAGTEAIWFTLVSRDTLVAPNLQLNLWTPHVATRIYNIAQLAEGNWLEPLQVPSSAGRYLSYMIGSYCTLTAGSIRALFVRGFEQPYGMQVIPTP